MYRRITIAAVAAITALALAACGGDDEATGSASQTPTSATAVESENHPVVDHITRALDKLDAPWGNVKYKGENEEAVSTDMWELDINNRGSYIHVFLDEDARKDWEQSAIWLDGITVAYDNVGISLNSGLDKHDSLALAPKLAEELGGRVTTGDTDLFRDDEDEESEPSGAPRPTPAAAPASAQAPTATCALDPIYEAGTTFYNDGTSGFTTACFDQFMTTNGTGNNHTSPSTGGDPSTWDYDGPRTENGDPSEHPQVQWANCLDEFGLEYCQENDPSGF